MRSRRPTILLAAACALGVLGAPSALAQGDDVARSLCKANTTKVVRQALGTKSHKAHPEGTLAYCGWNASSFDDPEIAYNIGWSDWTLDQRRLYNEGSDPALVDVTVGGRPGLYDPRPGGPSLFIDVDPGVLSLSVYRMDDDKVEAALMRLGEEAVARATGLVRMPPGDASLLGLFPAAIDDSPLITSPQYVRRDFPNPDDRRALRKAVEAEGKTLADVSMAQASMKALPEDPAHDARIFALRIADTDAAKFVPFLARGQTILPEALANGQVGYLAPTEGGDPSWVTFIYPKDDVVWSVYSSEGTAAKVIAALPGAPVAGPIPTPAPTPTPDISTPEGRLKAILPGSVSGSPLDQFLVFAGKQAEPYLPSKGLKFVRGVLKDQGKDIRDLVLFAGGYGNAVSVQGLRIEGGDGRALAPFWLDALRQQGTLKKGEDLTPANVGGKDVATTRFGDSTIYVYLSGDTSWVVTAMAEDAAAELLAALP